MAFKIGRTIPVQNVDIIDLTQIVLKIDMMEQTLCMKMLICVKR